MSGSEGFEAITRFVEDNLSFMTSHYNQNYLDRRIKSRMRRTRSSSYWDYYEVLQDDPGEHQELLDALSINVTGFFRNPEVWDGIREAIRDLSLSNNAVRIWSAACADGREPYSLAMLAMDDPRIDDGAVTIRATDINDRALELAERGVYESNHTADLHEQLTYLNHFRTYVDQDGDRFAVSDAVKEKVTFERHDLINDEAPGRFELVICRNLFIYIDTEYKVPVVETILGGLRHGGYLVLGKAETLPPASKHDFTVVDGAKRIYQRS